MAEPRQVTVRVIRTHSLERHESNSLRRRNSRGKLNNTNVQYRKVNPVSHLMIFINKKIDSF